MNSLFIPLSFPFCPLPLPPFPSSPFLQHSPSQQQTARESPGKRMSEQLLHRLDHYSAAQGCSGWLIRRLTIYVAESSRTKGTALSRPLGTGEEGRPSCGGWWQPSPAPARAGYEHEEGVWRLEKERQIWRFWEAVGRRGLMAIHSLSSGSSACLCSSCWSPNLQFLWLWLYLGILSQKRIKLKSGH